jgi:hypothetical protein
VNPVSPIPALIATIVALATTSALSKSSDKQARQGRFATIDGLRGYLALAVFLHHSCIWYFYLRTGQWKLPPSNFYLIRNEPPLAESVAP